MYYCNGIRWCTRSTLIRTITGVVKTLMRFLKCARSLEKGKTTQKALTNVFSGYGAVYKGKLRATGAEFAIKMLSMMTDEEAKELEGEIEILKQCQHAYIVGYYGTCKKNGKLWVS